MIEYNLTPWDSAALGMRTASITIGESMLTEDEIVKDLISVEEQLKDAGVQFIYTRIDSGQILCRKILQDVGYYFAESSLSMSKGDVHRFVQHKLPGIELTDLQVVDIAAVKAVAGNSFDFGRFHEDPNISIDHSRDRYYRWVDDIVRKSSATMLVAKKGGKIIGFNFQQEENRLFHAELILTGCARGYEVFALSLWNEIIRYNRDIGIKKVKALISASNVGVANIYAHFGFKIDQTLFGFHKRIS